ncbi:MAG: hypothetical protein LBQ60_20130 [Bacteroidales bacterium]|jgi:hypothetical protein|nr:hypothetical protein [Bacteroidales bacterium]
MAQNTFFHPDMRLSDLLYQDYRLHITLSLLGVKLGFCPDASVKDVCAFNKVDHNILLFIANIYASDDYTQEDYPEYMSFDDSLRYILKIHEYTQQDIIPRIEQDFFEILDILTPSNQHDIKKMLKDLEEIFKKYHSNFDLVVENYKNTHQPLDRQKTVRLMKPIDKAVFLVELMIRILSDKKLLSSEKQDECIRLKYFLSLFLGHIPNHLKIIRYGLAPMFTF